tara:strand:- start:3224 stop:3997 length:774 start_codon:yes stop_codon:yes gene_type:complete
MALPILAAAKMAKVAGSARAAPGKLNKYLHSESNVVKGMSKGERAWGYGLWIVLGLAFVAVITTVWWATGGFEKRKAPKNHTKTSIGRGLPRHIPSHKEHMFNRGNNHQYTGPEKSMLVTDSSDFQGYYGVNPDGFGETRETMTKARYRISEDKHHDVIVDEDMLEEELFTEQLKEGERMEKRKNRNKKRILANSYNTGHIEQTNELEAAAELSSGNDFTQKFAMNSAKGSNVRAYIKPLEKQSTTAHILDFAQIRK